MAVIANFVYGFPSRKLHVIGVTGTDGKTTTVNMIASILRAAGYKAAHLSTIDSPGMHTTTPSSFQVQKFLAAAVKAGNQYAVLETTSHALDQHRTWGIKFESAVLTNISHEHLDYHKDLVNYTAAKARLFKDVKFAVLNADDQSFDFLNEKLKGRQIVTYGLGQEAKVWADEISESLTNTKFVAHLPRRQAGVLAEMFPVELNLPGKFNAYNALAAIAVVMNYNVAPEAIQKGLMRVRGIKGRLEIIESDHPFNVMLDFAHTPNAISQLLRFLRPKISGKIIHVFGSAGERDKAKRPLMGEASDKYADTIVLTREDNRSESVENICNDIAKGIKGKQRERGYFVIPDRREAIRFGLRQAQADDFVIITGKGHEQSLNIDGVETAWDDSEIIKEELRGITH